MFQIIILNLILTLPYLAVAQSPVPQINGDCPSSTMKSGDYCVPKKRPNGTTTSHIVRNGRSCPSGYFKEGPYCWKGAGDAPESIPREKGKDCPHKWYKSGHYCWKGAGAD
jgi:hypothetical protein